MVVKLKLSKSPKKKIIITDDFYYDLFDGGYINPSELLEDDSAKKVQYAIDIIKTFENILRDNNILEDY